MVFVNSKELMGRLRVAYPFDESGYFFDGKCGSLPSVQLSQRVGIERIIRVTLRFALRVEATRLVGFTDHLAGWRAVPNSRKFAGVEVVTSEFKSFAHQHVYFRNPRNYADNYYFSDTALSWFAVFCHEGDWHLFSRHRRALSDLSLA